MKVYICDETTAAYSAGLIVVAANNIDEATKIIDDYGGDYYKFDLTEIKESPNLETRVNVPQILHVVTYFE